MDLCSSNPYLWWDAYILDRVASDVGLRHAPEPVTFLYARQDLLGELLQNLA